MERLLLSGEFSLSMPQSLLNLSDFMGLWGVSDLSPAYCSPPQPESLSLRNWGREKEKRHSSQETASSGNSQYPE